MTDTKVWVCVFSHEYESMGYHTHESGHVFGMLVCLVHGAILLAAIRMLACGDMIIHEQDV